MTIIDLMKELQYPFNQDGVCKGIALMAQRAHRAGQFDQFKARMDYLRTLKPNQLPILLKAAKQHDKDLRDQKTTIPLSQNEQIVLSTEAFFFQIWAHFNPNETQKFLDLNHGEYFNQLDTHKIETAMYDIGSANYADSPLPIPNTYLLRASNENNNSLKQFLETIKNHDELSPGCLISAVNHDIHFFYNKAKDKWVLTTHDQILELDSINEAATEIIYAFKKRKDSPDIVNIALSVYTDQKNEKTQSLSQELTLIENEAFDNMLKQSSTINQPDVYGSTFLHLAAMHGSAKLVSQLANQPDINLNALNNEKLSAFMLAVLFRQVEVVKELLKYPLDQSAANYKALPALFYAACQSNVEIVDALLKQLGYSKPRVNLPEMNPLFGAIINNQYDIVKRLLKEPNISKNDILVLALLKGSDATTINILLEDPQIGINSTYMRKAALHVIAEHGDIKLLQALFAREKSIIPLNEIHVYWMAFEPFQKPEYQGNTIYVSHTGEYKVFNINGEVRTGKIDTGVIDLSSLSPYNFALLSSIDNNPEKAVNGHIYLSKDGEYIVRDHNGILSSGKISSEYLSTLNLEALDTKINDIQFQTELTLILTIEGHIPTKNIDQNPEVKSQILSQIQRDGNIISFINVNVNGPQDNKAINIAAQHGHLNIVRELLKHPDIDLNYNPGLSKPPLLTQIVRYKTADSIKTLKLILQHPKINVNFNSPLCSAIKYGNISAVKALLEHNDIDVTQENPLELAINEGQYDILKLLIDHSKININQPRSNGLLPLTLATQHASQSYRFDKYVKAILSKEASFSPAIDQLNGSDVYLKNYYQAQPLLQCIQTSISSLNEYHNRYTKLLILDKEPDENALDNNTIALINTNNEWIIYRKKDDKIEQVVIDKSILDIDRIRSIENMLPHKIYKNYELIDYIMLQCSDTNIDQIEALQYDLGDFISDIKHIEFDQQEITTKIDSFCNQAMSICNSAINSNKFLFFKENQPSFNEAFHQAKLDCHKRMEQFDCSLQLGSQP